MYVEGCKFLLAKMGFNICMNTLYFNSEKLWKEGAKL